MKLYVRQINKRLREAEGRRTARKAEEDFRRAVAEVEMFFDEKRRIYNSPAEKAERERKYQELLEIGEQRRLAFERGEDSSTYPLPWEAKNV